MMNRNSRKADTTLGTVPPSRVSSPLKLTRLLIVPLISTPTKEPNTLPTPPVSSVPPITAEEMAFISRPSAWVVVPHMVFMQYRMPPMEHRKEDRM